MNEEMAATASMKFAFTGQSHQIDANTLINALINYSSVITEANKIFGCGNKNVEVKVNALEKGSFVIDLSVVENAFMGLVSGSLPYLSDLTTVVMGVFALYKHLKGRPAKTKEDSDVLKFDNVVIRDSVINVYNSSVVREAVSKSFETASGDSGVEGVKITNNKGETVEFAEDEFSGLIYNDFDEEQDIPDQRVVPVDDAVLVITKLSFEKGAVWSFVYNGFRISIPVRDEKLAELIDRGERFGKGDAIRVSLEIVQRYNQTYKVYENKSYKIRDFKEHIEYGGNPLPQTLI